MPDDDVVKTKKGLIDTSVLYGIIISAIFAIVTGIISITPDEIISLNWKYYIELAMILCLLIGAAIYLAVKSIESVRIDYTSFKELNDKSVKLMDEIRHQEEHLKEVQTQLKSLRSSYSMYHHLPSKLHWQKFEITDEIEIREENGVKVYYTKTTRDLEVRNASDLNLTEVYLPQARFDIYSEIPSKETHLESWDNISEVLIDNAPISDFLLGTVQQALILCPASVEGTESSANHIVARYKIPFGDEPLAPNRTKKILFTTIRKNCHQECENTVEGEFTSLSVYDIRDYIKITIKAPSGFIIRPKVDSKDYPYGIKLTEIGTGTILAEEAKQHYAVLSDDNKTLSFRKDLPTIGINYAIHFCLYPDTVQITKKQ